MLAEKFGGILISAGGPVVILWKNRNCNFKGFNFNTERANKNDEMLWARKSIIPETRTGHNQYFSRTMQRTSL